MDTVKLTNKKNVKMVAHRGLSGIERENTLPAFVAAGNRSYFGIETDVHRTADGRYVILHDDWTGRVSAGQNIRVEDSAFDLVRTVELTDVDGAAGRIDLRIPSLEEYITVCKRYEKKAVLEIKAHLEPEHIAEIVEIIRDLGYLEKVVFISFDLPNMIELRRQLPEQKLMYLTCGYDADILAALKTYRLDLDVCHPAVTAEMVDELHGIGLEVNCWTVDGLEDAQRVVEAGVDYITTNILE